MTRLHRVAGGTVTVVADIVGACKAGRESMPCVTDNITRHGITVAESVAGAYFFITCVLLLRKLRFFKTLPYSAAKRGIVYFTIQVVFLDPLAGCINRLCFMLSQS